MTLKRYLADYPDQALLAHLLEGVRLEADVELQTVLVPHLMSISQGFSSVSAELLRMQKLGWYEWFPDIPMWPMYFNAQGSVPRKLEPNRFRRTTEGGGPRRTTVDEEGLESISLNAAARAYHMPRFFIQDTRTSFQAWLAARGLPRPPEEVPLRPSESKWPREQKPMLTDILRDLAILRRIAEILRQPIYIFSDEQMTSDF